jgi:hypothetical protein
MQNFISTSKLFKIKIILDLKCYYFKCIILLKIESVCGFGYITRYDFPQTVDMGMV